jgi:hypothetical protein
LFRLSLVILGSYLPPRRGAATAPPRRRGLGPQPVVLKRYNLRKSFRANLCDNPSGDNLVSVVSGHATMPPATDAGSGTESADTIVGLPQKFDQLAEMVRSLTVEVWDVKQQ